MPSWRQVTLNDLGPELGIDLQVPWFDVRDARFAGGAKGDGVTDDTTAFQAAINAAVMANGTLYIPPCAAGYLITSTLVIQPAGSNTEAQLNIVGSPDQSSILWGGGNSTSVFQAFGWKRSTVESVLIKISNAAHDLAVWDLDVKTGATSTGQLSFRNCQVLLNAGVNNVGFRLGHNAGSAGGSELSFLHFNRCTVKDTALTSGTAAWINEHSNSLQNVWTDCTWLFVTTGFSTISTSGAGSVNGGDTQFFYGCGSSGGSSDYVFSTPGVYGIYGGRYENGKKFLTITNGTTMMDIYASGVKIANYTPADNCVIDLAFTTFPGGRPFNILFDNLVSYVQLQTAAFVKAQAASGRPSIVHFRGGAIYGADPFYTVSGAVEVRVERMQHLANTALQPDVLFDPQGSDQAAYRAVSTTYTATLFDAVIVADATGGAFTVTLPTSVGNKGRLFTVKRANTGANAVTVGTTSSQTIDGVTTQSLGAQFASLTVISDGANWSIVAKV